MSSLHQSVATLPFCTHPDTLFERLIQRVVHLPWRLSASLTIVLLGLPFALTYLERRVGWESSLLPGRYIVLPAVLLLYNIGGTPWVWRAEQQMVEALRPLVHLDAERFDKLVRCAGRRTALGAWSAFGLGVGGGAILLMSGPEMKTGLVHGSPLYVYLWLVYLAMFGLTVWSIYNAIVSARLTAAVQRHIDDVDLFDLFPFEAVGRQGLALSLLLIGGTTLSLVFVYRRHDFLYWQNLAIYLVLTSATILVFFLVMWPTHRTLERVKTQKLLVVQCAVGRLFRQFEELTSRNGDTHAISSEIQALLALEQRLKLVPTWPYTVEMLRTLLFSTLTPLLVASSRLVGTLISEGRL